MIKYKLKYVNNIINLPQKLIYLHQLMFQIQAFYLCVANFFVGYNTS